MKLKYLGTAAAEGIPGLFCECDNCVKARAQGGKNIRTRSQALVDDTLLIDMPPDNYLHMLQHKLELWKINDCLITHYHGDHLCTRDIALRRRGFSTIHDRKPYRIYADQVAYDRMAEFVAEQNITPEDVQIIKVGPGETFEAAGYTVTAIRATHDQTTTPLIYIIEKDGKSLLYAHDTGLLCQESMDVLKKWGKKLSMVSMDCTAGMLPIDYDGHMFLDRCVAFRQRLLDAGVADQNTLMYLNHFSHNGLNALYDDLLPFAHAQGFEVSYDGLEVEF